MMSSSEKSGKHQVYQNFMQKAAEEYYEKQAGAPEPPDLSFMKQSRNSKRDRSVKRYSAIAAAVLVVLIGGVSIGGLFTGENEVYGDKGFLHRIYNAAMGIGTDEQDEAAPEDYSESLIITDPDDLEEAVDFMDGKLYVPTYIPEGYTLKELSVEKTGDGMYLALYQYENKGRELRITQIPLTEDDQISTTDEGEMIRESDRIIYVKEELVGGEFSADIYMENEMLQLFYNESIDKNEAIKIAKGLKL